MDSNTTSSSINYYTRAALVRSLFQKHLCWARVINTFKHWRCTMKSDFDQLGTEHSQFLVIVPRVSK